MLELTRNVGPTFPSMSCWHLRCVIRTSWNGIGCCTHAGWETSVWTPRSWRQQCKCVAALAPRVHHMHVTLCDTARHAHSSVFARTCCLLYTCDRGVHSHGWPFFERMLLALYSLHVARVFFFKEYICECAHVEICVCTLVFKLIT